MKNRVNEIIYSEPVQEIISNPPAKIIRWGTAIIAFVFILLITLSWIIRYPDVIPAPVEITTINPPVTLVTKITGRINKLMVEDGEKVMPGQLLAVMETAASLPEIEMLKSIIDTISKPAALFPESIPLFSQLGEIQSYYSSFMKALADYNSYVNNDYYGSKIVSITEEITALQEYIKRMKAKEIIITDNLKLEYNKYKRDSGLYVDKVFSESEFELSKKSYNNSKLELQQVRLEQSQNIISLAEKNQLLQDYRIKREEERQNLNSLLDETFLNLKAQINIWRNNYLLITPVEGTVSFTKFWSENQSVVKDEPVISIVPLEPGDFVGRINLRMQRSGKVKPGQTVNIKLSGYPYLEYGMVRGIVKSKSLVPASDAYIIEIDLPSGLTTLYGKKLDFTQNMQGTAEILTDNLRLLQKVINPFRYLVTKNRI
ncbi:MAG TPA: HlyD family efflux transporter periplasmic adaptor subunit [Bacteroidales bacterium]|nr:HlyD family efflux transporter periplasmic adaptor subunit [Bacteroidales bacterium]HPI68784.1 HlyD family efflux transporter periplasmic adaptor subunit [Bacteroidales bacterium]